MAKKWKCDCGTENEDNFCMNCGKKVPDNINSASNMSVKDKIKTAKNIYFADKIIRKNIVTSRRSIVGIVRIYRLWCI